MRRLLMITGIALTIALPIHSPAAEVEDEIIVLPAPSPAPVREPVVNEPVPAQQAPASIAVPRRWLKPWTVDLRFMLGSAAPITDLEVGSIDTDINAGASGAFRTLVLFGYRPGGGEWGWIVGGGVATGGHGGDFLGDDDALSYNFFALEVTGGLLYVPTPGLQFEVKPFFRVGGGELDADELPGLDQDEIDSGGYGAGGMTLGMWYAWPSGFQVGGELGLEGWAGESEVDGEDVEVTGGGGFGAIGAGIRW